ncbi:hypothetical protein C2S51_006916 [Perilla frutescens var. frutescens]|nr:hypothetical protein C2S51_006916 [Perilla frutescens var. frutescens]
MDRLFTKFYNWNIFHIMYCDGSSFMSNVEEVDAVYNITYRGGRIFDAMMQELVLNKGMGNANSAILAGSSAGGLATILQCDKFRALFHNSSRVKCISDSGFFIHAENFMGADWREARFFNVISTHGLANVLPTSCTTKFSPTLCLFPENLVEDLRTPLFLIESAFDKFQVGKNVFSPNVVNHDPKWSNCTNDIMFCNWTHVKIMKDFRATFIETLNSTIDKSSSIGYFVHGCYRHGHILEKQDWICSSLVGNNVLAHKTIGQAVSDWYFDKSTTVFREIDMRNDLPRMCRNGYTVLDFERNCSVALQLSM